MSCSVLYTENDLLFSLVPVLALLIPFETHAGRIVRLSLCCTLPNCRLFDPSSYIDSVGLQIVTPTKIRPTDLPISGTVSLNWNTMKVTGLPTWERKPDGSWGILLYVS